jgi:hypothetical protein
MARPAAARWYVAKERHCMTQALSDESTDLAVFEHKKRREWGLAVLAWEHRDKRGYVFENGQLRVLVQAFFSMMRQVDRPTEEVRALHETLRPELDAARAEMGAVTQPAQRKSTSPVSFDDQLARFHATFPNGFKDDAWIQQHRGATASRRVGAHRDPSVEEAQQQLDPAVLDKRLAGDEYRAIYDSVLALLGRTDLVPAAELAVLRGAEPGNQRALALMVAELVHGSGEAGSRLDHFVTAFHRTFGKPPGWQLATALPALYAPDEWIVVRPAMFRTQAKRMVPGFSLPKTPGAAPYRRCLAMAQNVRARLEEREEAPRDLLDVYDFMRESLRSSSKRAAAK